MAQNWYGAGELWKKDVKSVRAGAETRKEFYGDKALRKVGSKLLGDVSALSTDELTTKLKEHAEITKDEKILAGKWDPEKVGPKRYISDILKDFFEKKCGSKRGTADALIALKFLNAEIENIDLIRAGETVEIENGILTVKSGGEVVARGAILDRSKLPAGSPEALARSGAVRKKTRAALAGVKAAVASTTARRGPTGAPVVPEPIRPTVAPPASPPAAPPAAPPPAHPAAPASVPPPAVPTAAPLAPPSAPPPAAPAAALPAAPAAPSLGAIPPLPPAAPATAPRTAPTAPAAPPTAPAAAPKPAAPAAPIIAPPGAPDAAPAPEKTPGEILADREKEVAGLKVKGYTIEKSKTPDPHDFYSAIFEVRPGKKREVVATIGVVKDSPENIHVHVKRPVFEKPGTQEDEIAGNFPDLAELAGKLPKLISPPEAEQKEKIAERRSKVEQALKAQKDLKALAHEIKLVEDKGPNKELAYFKMRLEGTTGPAVDVGFVGIYKENPSYLVLEKMNHARVGVFSPATALADAAANPANFTWGGGIMAPGAVPPDALPGAPAARPPAAAPPAAPAAAAAPRRKPAEVLKEVQTDIKKIKIADHTIRQIYSLAGAKVDKNQIAYEVKNDRTGKAVAVFDFQKATPDSIELFFVKGANDFEPGITRLSVAELERRLNERLKPTAPPPAPPAAPAAVPPAPSVTVDPFADLDARVAAAPRSPENDPATLTKLIDNLARDRKWDDVLLTAHLILTNPKSNADQKTNAELKSIDAYRAQGKVDLAITAYNNYLRLKPRDVAKSLEGGRYAFKNKKYNGVIDVFLPTDLTADTNERKAIFELSGDATFELKNYEAAKFYWERARGLYAPADANVGRIDEKLKKLPGAEGGAPEGAEKKGEVVTLTDANFERRVSKGIWVVDFWADWCGPCIEAAPAFHALAKEFGKRAGEPVHFARLNVDENRNIATNRAWKPERNIPYFGIIKDGKLIDGELGFSDAASFKRQLKRKINPLLGRTI